MLCLPVSNFTMAMTSFRKIQYWCAIADAQAKQAKGLFRFPYWMLNRTSFFKVLLAAILFFTFVVYVIQTLNSNLRRHQEVTNLRIDIHYKSKNLVIWKKKTKKIKERSTFSVRKLPQAITDRLLEKKQSIVKDFTTRYVAIIQKKRMTLKTRFNFNFINTASFLTVLAS